MRRIAVVVLLLALVGSSALFAVDLSVGADVPLGMTYWKYEDEDSVNGFLFGGEVVVNAMFTPQFAGELKIGLVVDAYSEEDVLVLGDSFDFKDRFLSIVGLFKYYVNPTFFVGAGLEYDRFLKTDWEYSDGTEDSFDRDDLADDEDIDPLFIVAVAGVDLIAGPRLIVPIAFNFGYGVANIPDDVTRMHIYGTVGIRYLL